MNKIEMFSNCLGHVVHHHEINYFLYTLYKNCTVSLYNVIILCFIPKSFFLISGVKYVLFYIISLWMSNLLGGTRVSKTSVFPYCLIFNHNATNEIHQNSRNLGHQWKDCILRIKNADSEKRKLSFLFLAPKKCYTRRKHINFRILFTL